MPVFLEIVGRDRVRPPPVRCVPPRIPPLPASENPAVTSETGGTLWPAIDRFGARE